MLCRTCRCSITYFDCIAMFEHWTAPELNHTHFIDVHIGYSWVYKAHVSPALNGSSAYRHFKHGDEMHGWVVSNFYVGLSSVLQSCVEIKTFSCLFRLCYRVWSAVAQNFVKGRAHMLCIDSSGIHASMLRIWAPSLTEVLHYSASKTVIRRNTLYIAE